MRRNSDARACAYCGIWVILPIKYKHEGAHILCAECREEGIEYGHIKENRDEGRIDGGGTYP